jgi:hypothetical protein
MEEAMTMKSKLRAAMFAAGLVLSVAAGNAVAQEIPVVTGDHWTKSSEQVKKAYLVGIANVIQVEAAYQAANKPSDAQSLVPRAAKGLQGQTLDSVREGLDRWYAANPAKLQRPVIETLWFEMIVPGIKKTK